MPTPSLPSRPTFGRRLLAVGAFVALAAIAVSAGCGGRADEGTGEVLAPADSERASVAEAERLRPRDESEGRVEGSTEVADAEQEPAQASESLPEGLPRPPLDVEHYASLSEPHERGALIHVLDEEGAGVEAVVWILEVGPGLSDRQLRQLRGGHSWPSQLEDMGGRKLGLTDTAGWLRAELPDGAFWLGASADTSQEYGLEVEWVVMPGVCVARHSLESAVRGPIEISLRPALSTLDVEVVAPGLELDEDTGEAFKQLRIVLRRRDANGVHVAAVGHCSFRPGPTYEGPWGFTVWDAAPPMIEDPGGWEVALEGGDALGAQPVPVTLDDLVMGRWDNDSPYMGRADSDSPDKVLHVPAFGGLDLTVRDAAGENLARPFELVLRPVRVPGKPRSAGEWTRTWEGEAGIFDASKHQDPATGEPASRFDFAPLPLGTRFEARLRLEASSHWYRTELGGPTAFGQVVRHEWQLEPESVVRLKGQLTTASGELPDVGVPRFVLVKDGIPSAGDQRRPPLGEDMGFEIEFGEDEFLGGEELSLRITWLDLWARVPLPDIASEGPIDLGRVVLGDAPLLASGRVVDPTGRGLGGVRVSIAARKSGAGAGTAPFQRLADVAFTDAEGAFEFRGRVAAEELGLKAESPRHASQDYVAFLPGISNANLVLTPGGQVSGRLTSSGEFPAARLELVLTDGESGAVIEGQRPDADGSFEFDSLEFDGDYGLAVTYRGLTRGAEPVELIDRVPVRSLAPPNFGGEPAPAPGFDPRDIGSALRTLRLEAVEPSGEPAARFQVRVTDAETGALLEQLEGTDGAWTLTLPDREVGLEVWSDDSARVLIPTARDAERVVLTDPLTLTVELARPEDLRFEGEPVPEYRMAVGLVPLFDDRPLQLPSSKSLVGPAGRARFQGLTFGSFDVQLQVSDPTSGRSGWVDLQLDSPPRLDLTSDNVDQVQRVDVPRAALLDAVVLALDLDVDTESGE